MNLREGEEGWKGAERAIRILQEYCTTAKRRERVVGMLQYLSPGNFGGREKLTSVKEKELASPRLEVVTERTGGDGVNAAILKKLDELNSRISGIEAGGAKTINKLTPEQVRQLKIEQAQREAFAKNEGAESGEGNVAWL